MNKVLVVGSLNMDYITFVDRAPTIGETVLGERFDTVPGGKGANQAYTIGKLGGNVSMIGAVGSDKNGKKIVRNLTAINVDTSGIAVLDECRTGTAFISIDKKGNNQIIVNPGANGKITKEMLLQNQHLFDWCDLLLLQMEIPYDIVERAAWMAKQREKTVVLDPAPAPDHFPAGIFRYTDIIKPNETEFRTLTGANCQSPKDMVEAARMLLDEGIEIVLVTLGEQGCVVVTREGLDHYPARNVCALDTTAAGDSFIAAFSLMYSPDNIQPAIEFATKVSSLVIQRKGAQSSIPSLEELTEN